MITVFLIFPISFVSGALLSPLKSISEVAEMASRNDKNERNLTNQPDQDACNKAKLIKRERESRWNSPKDADVSLEAVFKTVPHNSS